MLSRVIRLLLMATLVAPVSAQAVAVYSARTGVTVSAVITSTSGSASVLAEDSNFALDANATGHAITSAFTTAGGQQVDLLTSQLTLEAGVDGQAGPGIGDGNSLSRNDFLVDILNTGGGEVTVRLTIAWSQAVNASTDTLGEEAFATSDVLVDWVGGTLIDSLLTASASAGTAATDSSAGSSFFDFVLASGESAFVLGIVNADGSARSTVPEPGTLALLGLGLAGLAATRRRKQ